MVSRAGAAWRTAQEDEPAPTGRPSRAWGKVLRRYLKVAPELRPSHDRHVRRCESDVEQRMAEAVAEVSLT